MLLRLITDPLLVREMMAGARKPSADRAAYPGISWTLAVCFLSAALFALYGERGDLYSSCAFFVLAAWLQSWLLFRRSGASIATSLAGEGERGALLVIRTSPYGLFHALAAKFLGVLMPLNLEMLLIFLLNAVIYAVLGSVPWIIFFSVCLFQVCLVLAGTGLGAIFGRYIGDAAKAAKSYRTFSAFIGVTGAAMCYGQTFGKVCLMSFIVHLLLFLIPSFGERLGMICGSLAVLFMVFMPFAMLFNLNPLYLSARAVNPFAALWQVQPINISDKHSLLGSNLNGDEDFSQFIVNSVQIRIAGKAIALSAPNALEIVTNNAASNPDVANYINSRYVAWRLGRLLKLSAGGALLFVLMFGWIWRRTHLDICR
ncbi:hypothetical protein IJT17_04690 [bacterium]|nr:hypothetical protein [bacterium]